MSHSPESDQDRGVKNSRSEFIRQLKRVDTLINNGGSLSGNEPNCAFLNLGHNRFATASHISGLDFADDGRSYCLTDWDNDGDVDLWTMNRTGPRIRFLQNNQACGNHFLRIKLVGTKSNRDAIGSKVAIELSDDATTNVRTKVLRAGQGFLSQSSKYIHFGLGRHARVSNLTVQWPNGTSESFGAVPIDSNLQLTEGSGKAIEVTLPKAAELPDTKEIAASKTEQAHIVLASRIPVPRLPWEDRDGKVITIESSAGLTLINIWASWCVPCRQELDDLVKADAELKRMGISVIALSADKLAGGDSAHNDSTHNDSTHNDPAHNDSAHDDNLEGIEAARKFMLQLSAPFATGFATKPLIDRLQFLDDFLFSQKRKLPIPFSVLIDQNGRLAAIVRGPIPMDKLSNIVTKTKLNGKARYDASVPFEGNWIRPRTVTVPLRMVVDMVSKQQFADAAHYILENESDLAGQRGYVALVGQLAGKVAKQNNITTAIRLDRSALKQDSENVAIMNNLAWRLTTHPDKSQRDAKEAIRIAESAAKLTKFETLPVLDTLVAALLEDGNKDGAVEILKRCVGLAESRADPKLEQRFRRQLKDVEK